MKVAVCQTDIFFEDRRCNYAVGEEMIGRAARKNADIALFPEMSFTGFSMNTALSAEKNSDTSEYMKRLAQQYDISIGFGWVKKRDTRAENHYSIVSRRGKIVLDYIKLHSFSPGGEDRHFTPGDSIETCILEGMPFSVFICYDLRFPEIFQAASNMVSSIIVPANWPEARSEHWKCLLRARAIETQCYIIGINCVGMQGDTLYQGHSAVLNPAGETILELSDSQEMQICEIEDDANFYRDCFPYKRDRRQLLYSNLWKNIVKYTNDTGRKEVANE